MDESRLARYREKMEYVIDALESIREPRTQLELSGVFYNLITSIEASMDLIAMLLRDLGERIEDDYTNVDKLVKLGILSDELGESLKKCNGLRNWLVHRYNRVDPELVMESVEEVKETLYSLLRRLEEVLNEIAGSD